MATSFGGSLRAIVLIFPVRMIGDPNRGQREPLIMATDPFSIVVTSTGKADHLPGDHVAVAAINRVGEKALLGVLQKLFEEASLFIAEIDRAVLEAGDDFVFVLVAKFRESLAAMALTAVIVECRQRLSVMIPGATGDWAPCCLVPSWNGPAV